MSRSESTMSDEARMWSHSWVMTVMMVGLVGCTMPSPRPAPAGDAAARTRQKSDKLSIRYSCQNQATPTMLYEPDAGPEPSPLPDGGMLELVGCVIPGGAVAFTSACDRGMNILGSADEGVVTDAGTSCSPGDGGSVILEGDRFTILLSTQGSSCQLGISTDLVKDADASVTWSATSNCGAFLPIKGTVEIATTDPNTCIGGDC